MGLINLVSHLPMPIRLHEPHPDPQRPGESPELRSVVVPGKSHPDARPTVTKVDGDVFDAWMSANAEHAWLADDRLRVVSDEEADELANGALAFGFEPGLAAVDAAGVTEGSMEGDAPHHAIDMTPYSDTPNDDSPRSQSPVLRGVVPGPVPQDPEPSAPTQGIRSAELHQESREPAPIKPAEQMSEAELEHATRP